MRKANIIVLNEHGLFPCQLNKLDQIHTDFTGFGKASRVLYDVDLGSRMGCGGVAILWHKSLSSYMQPMPEYGTDRICVTKVNLGSDNTFYLIAIYLPYQGCKIASFDDELYNLETFINDIGTQHSCFIIGDTNCHVGRPYTEDRSWGQSYANTHKLFDTMNRNQLSMIDIGSKGRGPTYSFASSRGFSYIDHCIVSCSFISKVGQCEVI